MRRTNVTHPGLWRSVGLELLKWHPQKYAFWFPEIWVKAKVSQKWWQIGFCMAHIYVPNWNLFLELVTESQGQTTFLAKVSHFNVSTLRPLDLEDSDCSLQFWWQIRNKILHVPSPPPSLSLSCSPRCSAVLSLHQLFFIFLCRHFQFWRLALVVLTCLCTPVLLGGGLTSVSHSLF